MSESLAPPIDAAGDLSGRKAALRASMVERVRALSPEDRRTFTATANHQLATTITTLLPPGASVALYAPTPTELSCEKAIDQLSGQYRLAFPRVDGDALVFHETTYTSLTAHASFVREPAPSAPVIVPDAVVVPARAYDRTGVRLGRGAGYFDRTFPRLPDSTLWIGFSFAVQLVDALPRAPHDGAVHLVLTEGGPLRCRPLPARYEPIFHASALAGGPRPTRSPWTST